jgi:putative PIG3 family NAD(P)H quinone oxidoreductase
MKMQAITFENFGEPSVMRLVELPLPEVRDDDLLVRVRAAGVNRADINQRQGRYGKNAEFGDSPLLGLEIAGEVVALGKEVVHFKVGDRVMGIVGGGGYAQYARINAGMAIAVPDGISDIDAAAITETFVTAHQALIHLGELSPGEKILIHGAGGGVGTSAVQLAIAAGAGVVITTSSASKCDRLQALGVHLAIDYESAKYAEVIAEKIGAIDLILDVIGGPYLEPNVRSLDHGGRLIQLGVQSGGNGMLPLDLVLQRRLRIQGTVMKSVSKTEKCSMVKRFSQRWMQDIQSKRLRPIVDSTFPLSQASDAHTHMALAKHFGKIVLQP